MNTEKILQDCKFKQLVTKLKQLRDKLFTENASSTMVTEYLTKEIQTHFETLNFQVVLELKFEAIYTSKRRIPVTRIGKIDLVIFANQEWQIAIEIDRANKKWSVEKLRQYKSSFPNTMCIWIRWKGRIRNVDTSDIILVDLLSSVESA